MFRLLACYWRAYRETERLLFQGASAEAVEDMFPAVLGAFNGFKAGAAWEGGGRVRHIIELDRQHCNRLQDLTERSERLDVAHKEALSLLEEVTSDYEQLEARCVAFYEALYAVKKMRCCNMIPWECTDKEPCPSCLCSNALKEPSATGEGER